MKNYVEILHRAMDVPAIKEYVLNSVTTNDLNDFVLELYKENSVENDSSFVETVLKQSDNPHEQVRAVIRNDGAITIFEDGKPAMFILPGGIGVSQDISVLEEDGRYTLNSGDNHTPCPKILCPFVADWKLFGITPETASVKYSSTYRVSLKCELEDYDYHQSPEWKAVEEWAQNVADAEAKRDAQRKAQKAKKPDEETTEDDE